MFNIWHLEYTEQEKSIIAQYSKDNPLHVLCDPSRYPYSYNENGDMKGIIPDYFRKNWTNRADLPMKNLRSWKPIVSLAHKSLPNQIYSQSLVKVMQEKSISSNRTVENRKMQSGGGAAVPYTDWISAKTEVKYGFLKKILTWGKTRGMFFWKNKNYFKGKPVERQGRKVRRD